MKQPNKVRIVVLLVVALFMGNKQYSVRAGDSQSHDKVNTAKSTKYIIIVTGGELLSGAYPDGHTYFITRTLRPLGLECIGSMSVNFIVWL